MLLKNRLINSDLIVYTVSDGYICPTAQTLIQYLFVNFLRLSHPQFFRMICVKELEMT